MATTAGGPGDLLEREDLLARIDDALDGAREDRGRLVVVEGPAGIGKTAIMAAARMRAEALGIRALRARGAELERDFAFGVVRQLLEPVLAAAPETERAALLEGPAGRAAELLDLPRAGAPGQGLAEDEPPGATFAVLHGLYWLCAGLAAQRPLLLTLDDAHWADASSLRFLAFLAPRLEELPVVLLVAARPRETGSADELVGALAVDPAAEVLRIAPLSERAVARMLEAGLGAPADPAFAAACQRATGGSPLLLRELVGALAGDGVAPTADAVALVADVEARTIGRWALVQLGRLAPPAAALAKAVAVLETAGVAHAAAVAGLAPDAAGDAADSLAAAGLLEPGRPLAFAHPIVRAGVYGELTGAERTAGHRRAAELLAPDPAERERVAEHLVATEPAADPWVVERLAAAARAASARGAPDSSAAYLRRAIREPPPADRRAAVLLDLGVAELSAGDPCADEHLADAVEAVPAGPGRVRAALVRAHALALAQRSVEAVDVIDRAVGRARRARTPRWRSPPEAAAVAIAAIDTAHRSGDGAPHPRVARARGRRPRRRRCAAARVAAIALAAQAGDPAEIAADYARRALAAGPRPGLPDPHRPAVVHDGDDRARLDPALGRGDRRARRRSSRRRARARRRRAAVGAARPTGPGSRCTAATSSAPRPTRAWCSRRRGCRRRPLWRALARRASRVDAAGRAGPRRGGGGDRGRHRGCRRAAGGYETAAVLRHGRGRARACAPATQQAGIADVLRGSPRDRRVTHAACLPMPAVEPDARPRWPCTRSATTSSPGDWPARTCTARPALRRRARSASP